MSRQHIYNQKEEVKKYASELDKEEPEVAIVRLDKSTIERTVLSLVLYCQTPYSGVVSFFENVYGMTISRGKISGIIAEATERAEAFDATVDLSKIQQGANDEIFQCGIPVLTGIDPESTYTYLLEEAENRTAETWAFHMECAKEQGLNLEVSINDGGTGLMSGIPQAFPDIEIQADTFHTLYTLGKEVSKLERKANKLIKNEAALLENLEGKRPRAKNKEKLEKIRPLTEEAVRVYDLMYILLSWLKEMLSFSGYSMAEAMAQTEWILYEMDIIAVGSPSLQKEIQKVRKMLPSLLSFIGRLERRMEVVAGETRIPAEAFRLMYQQLTHKSGSPQDCEIQGKLSLMLAEQYSKAQSIFLQLLNRTKKASSIVENLNGRIRVFIEVKRIIPTRFFVLLKVFFNTRRYPRSRYKERVGKSPLELLTGNPEPDFLEALGY
jgi:hypothetical protein